MSFSSRIVYPRSLDPSTATAEDRARFFDEVEAVTVFAVLTLRHMAQVMLYAVTNGRSVPFFENGEGLLHDRFGFYTEWVAFVRASYISKRAEARRNSDATSPEERAELEAMFESFGDRQVARDHESFRNDPDFEFSICRIVYDLRPFVREASAEYAKAGGKGSDHDCVLERMVECVDTLIPEMGSGELNDGQLRCVGKMMLLRNAAPGPSSTSQVDDAVARSNDVLSPEEVRRDMRDCKRTRVY